MIEDRIEEVALNDESECFFLVFVRKGIDRPQEAEAPVAACSSYEEANRVGQELRKSGRRCVVRFVGPTGGGD